MGLMKRTNNGFSGKHVVITGGSEGVGLSLAKLLAAQGAKLSLLARTQSKLEAARDAVSQCVASDSAPRICIYIADVTVQWQVESAVATAVAALGPVDVLIACAGGAQCGYFHECDASVFARQMAVNYMGAVHATKAVYDMMVARNTGHICLIASTMSLLGFVGYSAYAPSKYAVRGLAECLRNELVGTGVRVSISYPADMDTPGYERENLTKPPETAQISEATLCPPEQVARLILAGMQRGDFVLPNTQLQLSMLQSITKGVMPRQLRTLLLDMLLGLLGPIIGWVVAADFDGVAAKGAQRRFARLWTGLGGAPAAGASSKPSRTGSHGHVASHNAGPAQMQGVS